MTRKQNVEFSFRKKLEPKHVHQLSIRNIVSEYMVSQVVLFLCSDKYHRLRWKKSPPQQSTFMSTMVGPAQKIGRSSWEQAINLPNHATILLRPCWSGIVKKRKEKISFSIRKWPTSWRNRIKAKKHIENLLFLTKQPFQRPQSTAYAFLLLLMEAQKNGKKELFLIELVMFLFKKWWHEKPQKTTIKLTFGLKKQSAVTVKHEKTFLNLW